MGLNLNIGRVVFSTTIKFDGDQFRTLTVSEALQIGGRAGRFGSRHTAAEGGGTVTALYHDTDLQFLKEVFASTPPPMQRAQLSPSTGHLLAFCRRFPSLPLSSYLHNLRARHSVDDAYELGSLDSLLELATITDNIQLDPYQRVTLCYAPAAVEKYPSQRVLVEWYARRLSAGGAVPIPSATYVTRPGVPTDPDAIDRLEETFSNLDLYVWLAHRFGAAVMPHAEAARRDRDLIAQLIHSGLEALGGKRVREDKKKLQKQQQQPAATDTSANTDATGVPDAVVMDAVQLVHDPNAPAPVLPSMPVSATPVATAAAHATAPRSASVPVSASDVAAAAAAARTGTSVLAKRQRPVYERPAATTVESLSADAILAAIFAPDNAYSNANAGANSAGAREAAAAAARAAALDLDAHSHSLNVSEFDELGMHSVFASKAAPLPTEARPSRTHAARAAALQAVAIENALNSQLPQKPLSKLSKAPAPAPAAVAAATYGAQTATEMLGLSGGKTLTGLAKTQEHVIKNKVRVGTKY